MGRAPRIWSGDANTNCAPDFRKSTAQNSPKHAISSEKFIFFWGGDLALPDLSSWTALHAPSQAFWIQLCVLQNSSRIYVCAEKHRTTGSYHVHFTPNQALTHTHTHTHTLIIRRTTQHALIHFVTFLGITKTKQKGSFQINHKTDLQCIFGTSSGFVPVGGEEGSSVQRSF